MKKENKIMVVVSPDPIERESMVKQLAVRLGFAVIPSDAAKIIRRDIHDIDLSMCYYVLCSNYHFRSSPLTTQRLYELSARGLAIVVGSKSIPREYEFICQAFYPEEFNRLTAQR